MNIRFLQKQGHSVRQTARMTGHSRNTVRKLLRAKTTPTPKPRERGSKLDAHRDYLTERWQANRLSAVRLFGEIQPRAASPVRSRSCAASLRNFRRPTASTRG